MDDRRAFLRGLAALPMIGGSVALIGKPTAAAVPVTGGLLDTYDYWLDMERSCLRWERYGRMALDARDRAGIEVVWLDRSTGEMWTSRRMHNLGALYHDAHPAASTRAAIVLSAVGCPLDRGCDDG